GLDVWPLISGKPADARSPHEAYYFYWGRELQAVRGGRWKLHFPHAYRTLAGKPGGAGGPPPAGGDAQTPLALYDLEEDPGETRNVADAHADVVDRLRRVADRARADLGDSAAQQEGKGVRPPGRVD